MSAKNKLIEEIRNNPNAVRFDDACKVARWLGFVHEKQKGSHKTFCRSGEEVGLNFQNHKGSIPRYQARQLIAMIDKYHEYE